MKFFINNFFLVLVVLLTGCGGTLKPAIPIKEKKTPEWFLNPLKSTSLILNSIGEGENREAAIADALKNIASSLSILIKSEFKSSSSSNNFNGLETYAKYTKNTISTKVKAIRIVNYKILNSEKLAFDKYIVCISVKKSDIFNSIKDEIDKKLALLESQEKTELSNSNTLNQLRFYKHASVETNNLIYQSVILKVLNPSFDDDYIVKKISHFQDSYIEIRSKISFSIRSNKTAQNLVPVIQNIFNDFKVKVSSTLNKYHYILSITSSINYSNAYGFIIARSSIIVTLQDYKNQIISTKTIDLIGQSTQNKRIAKENIAYKLANLIKKNGISAILDINL